MLGLTSVSSQLICDSDGNILSVEKCCVGSMYEEDMWYSSIKGKEMEEEKFSVPPPPVAGKIEPLHPSKLRTVPAEIIPEALKARQEIIDDKFSSSFSSQDTSNQDTEEDA
ncbi:hypothetical protein NQZ68_031750 [Dissostichus eleginoides]|nr:hypothetical protein NQZ68_031750 [Dissostichus eleginoides]